MNHFSPLWLAFLRNNRELGECHYMINDNMFGYRFPFYSRS